MIKAYRTTRRDNAKMSNQDHIEDTSSHSTESANIKTEQKIKNKAQQDASKEAKMRERAATEHAGFDPESWRECLSFKYLGAWISLGILAITAYIPNRIRDGICAILAFLFFKLNIKFKRVYMVNLETVYPQYSYAERETIYRKFLWHCFISFLSYGEPLFLPKWMLARRWKLKNPEVLEAAKETGRPIIFVVPHFVNIDRCGLYLSYSGLPMFAMVNNQKNKLYDWFINYQRIMFGGTIHTRNTGFRSIIRALRYGQNAYILIDEDMGPEQKFVPFCGVPKSTVDILSRLVATTNAVVLVECPTYNLKTANYELEFERFEFTKEETVEPKMELDLEALKDEGKLKEFIDSIDISRKPYERMLQELEKKLIPRPAPYLERLNEVQSNFIHNHPEQYMWFLRIFKTRPDERYFVDLYDNIKDSNHKVETLNRVDPLNAPQESASGANQRFSVDYELFVKARALLRNRYNEN